MQSAVKNVSDSTLDEEIGVIQDYSRVKLFFILGRGRSGTTLLRLILDNHPNLSVAPEALFVMNLCKRYAQTEWNRKKILSFCDDLWLEKRLDQWNLNKTKLRQDLLDYEKKASFSDLCKIVYANYAFLQGKNGDVVLGDKNPNYLLVVNELLNLFPDSSVATDSNVMIALYVPSV